MNWTLAILQAIIIAGLSSLITYFISRRQKALEFTYDYRKYILDKRKAAYEKVEIILGDLGRVEEREGTPPIRLHVFVIKKTGRDPFTEFTALLASSLEMSFWLSKNMISAINDLHEQNMQAFIAYRNDPVSNRYNAARAHFDAIEAAAQRVIKMYYKDIIHLDNIEAFKKEKDLSLA